MLQALAPLPKSPEAFRTISEVADDLDVPQHVLRFWESRFAQVKPVKRAGGRRYYRPEDVDLLRGIRALLYCDGFTIKGVQKVLRDRGLRHVAELGRSEAAAEMPANDAPRDFLPHLGALAPDELDGELDHKLDRTLAMEERARLCNLLAELEQLKARLRAARSG